MEGDFQLQICFRDVLFYSEKLVLGLLSETLFASFSLPTTVATDSPLSAYDWTADLAWPVMVLGRGQMLCCPLEALGQDRVAEFGTRLPLACRRNEPVSAT